MLHADLDSLVEHTDVAAVDELFAHLYDELHRLAERALRREGGTITLGATTLLHEAYLAIAERHDVTFIDRGRFLAYASRAMRGLVVDFARRRCAVKRGRALEITLVDDNAPSGDALRSAEDLVRLGEALGELSRIDPALVEVVDLRFFCGFSFAEIAGLRGVSERTVQRNWRKARMLLHRSLLEEGVGAGL